eukprot:scaffold7479_cov56-Phaeocystis_antarctica.AAC.1
MGPRAPQAHLGVTPSARAARQRSALGRRQHVQVSERLIDDLPHGEVVALGLGEGGDHTVQTSSRLFVSKV